MRDRSNTIVGWALAAGIVALGTSIVTGEMYSQKRPEKMGYPIEGVQEETEGGAAAAEQPIAVYLASADPAKGADVFKKCAACHNADKGGPNALGPNLYGVVGEPIGQGKGGYPFSDVLKAHGGNWTFDELNKWLTSPKGYAPGTKMTFAGLSKPEDRANVIAYLNKQSDAPEPLPTAPPAGAASADKAAAESLGSDVAKAKNQPVQNEAQAGAQPKNNIMGEAAPATSGTSQQQK